LSSLLLLPERKRIDAMKAISLYAKFSGRYNQWSELRRLYGLKWTTNNNAFPLISQKPFPKLVEEARQLINVLSIRFMHEIQFMALSGLRVENQ